MTAPVVRRHSHSRFWLGRVLLAALILVTLTFAQMWAHQESARMDALAQALRSDPAYTSADLHSSVPRAQRAELRQDTLLQPDPTYVVALSPTAARRTLSRPAGPSPASTVIRELQRRLGKQANYVVLVGNDLAVISRAQGPQIHSTRLSDSLTEASLPSDEQANRTVPVFPALERELESLADASTLRAELEAADQLTWRSALWSLAAAALIALFLVTLARTADSRRHRRGPRAQSDEWSLRDASATEPDRDGYTVKAVAT